MSFFILSFFFSFLGRHDKIDTRNRNIFMGQGSTVIYLVTVTTRSIILQGQSLKPDTFMFYLHKAASDYHHILSDLTVRCVKNT